MIGSTCKFLQACEAAAAFKDWFRHLPFSTIDSLMTSTPATATNPLTRREIECLQWISRGKTSWEISQILGISERTVIFHIENGKKKLGVKNRSQASVVAIMAGYIKH